MESLGIEGYYILVVSFYRNNGEVSRMEKRCNFLVLEDEFFLVRF